MKKEELVALIFFSIIIGVAFTISMQNFGEYQEQQAEERRKECIENYGQWVDAQMPEKRYCIYDYIKENK